MEIIGEFRDEIDSFLLSAVRQGDVKGLESYLSILKSPDIYLNRIYEEPDEQKCSLLMIACLNKYEDMVKMLLNCSNLDLEVLNDIQILEKDEKQWKYENVTVLWAAAAIDNFEIVKLLVEHKAQVNHRAKTNSTVLRCACFNGNIDMVRYLIENGADVRIAKEHNGTNLIASVYNKDLKMTTYLLDELGCDVNECTDEGRSPLYFAVNRKSLELVQCLLDRDACNFRAVYDQMSPLILAAESRQIDLVNAISCHCALLEQIEAEELLGSAFACAEHGDCDLEKSLEYFSRALERRLTHNLPKTLRLSTVEIFDNRQECQTIDQLKELHLNPDDIYIEALLVRERLLGPTNTKYHHSLRCRGVNLANIAQYRLGLTHWLYELDLCRQHSMSINKNDLRRVVKCFSEMTFISLAIPVSTLETIITVIVEQLELNTIDFDHNLYTLLFLITIISQLLSKSIMSPTDRKMFYRHIRFAIQRRYVTHAYKSSLLHLSLCDCTSANDRLIDRNCIYPCLNTARILLHCGADVNATDSVQNTPLHVLAANLNMRDNTILQLLCDANAHLDYANVLGDRPIDIASNSNIVQFLKIRMKISLKCLCAKLIKKMEVPFHGKIAASLVKFVEKH